MDAQEIFRNQDDFTIADNKKVITVYSAHQRSLYKVKIFVERLHVIFIVALFREARSEGREGMLKESEERLRS